MERDPDHDEPEGTPTEDEEDLPELDVADPLKRDPDESLPGLDPMLPPVPPE